MPDGSPMEYAALHPGDSAPPLDLFNADGEPRSLAAMRGRSVIVYFFPKAFSPGCTTEVCEFRDHREPLARAGYLVWGVSGDPIPVLREFADTHRLNHDLLCDPGHEATRRWGAWGPKKVDGAPTVGPLRSTFVIDADGRIQSAEYHLDAATHVGALAQRITSSSRTASQHGVNRTQPG